MAQPSFEDKIIECIDKGMASIGESATKAILWHIEQNSHLKLKEISSKPEQFVNALKDILGPGATTVERLIVREVNSTFKITGKVESFTEAVARARKANK
ncbi:MAG: hypothetical protein JRN52_01490 [Nitrososphaerota archaeon]|nr:hypothetical protein [Nitrososphaerota archaeon]